MQLEVVGQAGGKIDDAIIEKWRPHFQRMRHADAVDFVENVVGQVVALVELEEALQATARTQVLQHSSQRG